MFDVTYFTTDSYSDELISSVMSQLHRLIFAYSKGAFVSWELNLFPQFWPEVVSKTTSFHDSDISLHNYICSKKQIPSQSPKLEILRIPKLLRSWKTSH